MVVKALIATPLDALIVLDSLLPIVVVLLFASISLRLIVGVLYTLLRPLMMNDWLFALLPISIFFARRSIFLLIVEGVFALIPLRLIAGGPVALPVLPTVAQGLFAVVPLSLSFALLSFDLLAFCLSAERRFAMLWPSA